MLVTDLQLAAAGGDSTDPWHVLGNSYAERLAIVTLADLTLLRLLQVAPAADDESPAARRLHLVPAPPAPGVIGWAHGALASVTKQLDVDRAVRALRDVAPVVEAQLVAEGALVEQGQKGLLRKRTVLAPEPTRLAAAQHRVRSPGRPLTATSRAMVVLSTFGLPRDRLAQLAGGALDADALAIGAWDPFDPALLAPDGHPLGPNAADLLTSLVYVLAGTHDTTGWVDD